MTAIPDAAVTAAIEGLAQADIFTFEDERDDLARVVIQAAMPAIRDAIAQEIEEEKVVTEHLRDVEALDTAARIVRGGA